MGRIGLIVLAAAGLTAILGCHRPGGTPAPPEPRATPPAADATAATADAAAAVDVIRRYYEAIAGREYRRAYESWGSDGAASGQSFDQFAAGFAHTAHVAVSVGEPGRIEGAAGSRYIDIPVVVRATTDAGEQQRFEGRYTLRRVVVDGATPAQRRWHLSAAHIARVTARSP